MKVLHFDFKKDKKLLESDVFTIGNFDGVHSGHKKLIEVTSLIAENLNTGWGIITFVPNTKSYFDANYKFLNSLEQKLFYLEKLKVPKVVIMDFTKIHMLTSKKFIQDYLIDILNVKAIVSGSNFKLGKDLFHFKDIKDSNNMKHNYPPESIISVKNNNTKFDKVYTFTNTLVKTYAYTSAKFSTIPIYSINVGYINGEIVSSTNIKKLLQEGNIKDSNRLLGYNFVITSKVIHGNKLGRTLGFPTINLLTSEYVKLKYGIYATRTILSNGEKKDSVSSFGVRPTIANSDKQEILETFIFDYNDDLYDQTVSIEFIDFIREEKKFDSLDDLVVAIKKDVEVAKKILNLNKDINNHDN